jgi:SAM-dependent methyltransferase
VHPIPQSAGQSGAPPGAPDAPRGLPRDARVGDVLGRADPFSSVLTHPLGRDGVWDPDEFFASGERDVERLMAVCDEFGLPARRACALEVGCGVGRLLRALARRFERCTGFDVSPSMLERAAELTADVLRCGWVCAGDAPLPEVARRGFDLVVSHLVLQHLPNRAVNLTYIAARP